MTGAELPEDGYEGAYVAELAERIAAEGVDPADTEALGRRGVELMLEGVRATLDRFGVRFDTWFSERDLYQRGEVDAALAQLDENGHTYGSEGALWLRTTEFGDDKDRVLIRAGGEPTYLAADVAYHWDKLERGFGRLIDVLGADHHGYVPRIRAAIAALGADPDPFEALIMRLVHIVEEGERAQMSKRNGDFVSLDELIDDIGVDAARWFMLWRSHDTTVDLDLDLARRQSNDNPVYYVQYAHARIASILRKAGEGAGRAASEAGAGAAGEALEPTEKELIKRLLEFPDEVRESAARRAPHRICAYSMAVAADFHAFYRDCQVVGAEGEGVERSRLALCLLHEAHDRRVAGPAGHLRPRADVMLRRRGKPPVLAEISASPAPGDARPGTLRRADFEALGALLAKLAGSRAVLVTGGEEGKSAVALGLAAAADRRRQADGAAGVRPGQPGACRGARPGALSGPSRVPALGGERAADPPVGRPRRPASGGATAPLVCVVAGAPTPDGATLLASEGFRHAAAKLRSAYELLVLDGPPTGRGEGSLKTVADQADATLACLGPSEAFKRLPVPVTGVIQRS